MTLNSLDTSSLPTLASSMVVIDLSISAWTNNAKDVTQARRIEHDNDAAAGVVKVTKKLIASHKLDALHKRVALMRNHHTKMTTAWGQLKQRCMRTDAYLTKYEPAMAQYQAEFTDMVNDFLPDYPALREAAKQSYVGLGKLFNEDDYPLEHRIARKFSFTYCASPMPQAGNWIIDTANEAAEVMRRRYEHEVQQRVNDAMAEVWQRAHKAVTHMVERLDYAGDEDKKKFHDTLVPNVLDAVAMLEELNIAGDPAMREAHRRLAEVLDGVTTQALRHNKHLRDDVRVQVADVAAKMAALPGFGF
jgi:hypothetical protein